MSFLTAEWRKLVMVNYAIDPVILKKYIPPKTELDLWNDTCYVSLVGFMFLNTRILGMSIPFHRHFEEVNLRFYVRYKDDQQWRRGVVFIKEIVPRSALTFVANTLYREHYQTLKMSHHWGKMGTGQTVRYGWILNGKEHSISVSATNEMKAVGEGSEAEFITEHYWGYTRANPHSFFEYEVTHPRWGCYDVTDFQINLDFDAVYGHDFSDLSNMKPVSVMLAEGSPITVKNKRRI